MTFIESTPGAIAKLSLALALLCCSLILAADTLQTPNVKLGLWESTGATEISGEMPIPPEAQEQMARMREAMAKMPPDQRAKMEALMNAAASAQKEASRDRKPTVRRSCVKKEDLDKLFKFGDIEESCTRTFLTSSSSRQEMRIQCAQPDGMKQTGSVRIEVVNPENVKGSMQMTVTNGAHTMSWTSSFSAKWIGPACDGKE
jgi:hypothetical protein